MTPDRFAKMEAENARLMEGVDMLLTMVKRPVAWRVKDFADGWIIFQDEVRAQHEAKHTGALIQGLYVKE